MKHNFFVLSLLFIFLFSNKNTNCQCVNIQYTGSPTYSNQTSFGFIGSLLHDCGELSSGNYYIDRYYVQFDVYGDFSNSTIDISEPNCSGWDGTLLGQTQCKWGDLYYNYGTHAIFFTYVY